MEHSWNKEPGMTGNEGDDEPAGTLWLRRSASS